MQCEKFYSILITFLSFFFFLFFLSLITCFLSFLLFFLSNFLSFFLSFSNLFLPSFFFYFFPFYFFYISYTSSFLPLLYCLLHCVFFFCFSSFFQLILSFYIFFLLSSLYHRFRPFLNYSTLLLYSCFSFVLFFFSLAFFSSFGISYLISFTQSFSPDYPLSNSILFHFPSTCFRFSLIFSFIIHLYRLSFLFICCVFFFLNTFQLPLYLLYSFLNSYLFFFPFLPNINPLSPFSTALHSQETSFLIFSLSIFSPFKFLTSFFQFPFQ